jgi:asparagine synthase (glutamine-hydrolysing)
MCGILCRARTEPWHPDETRSRAWTGAMARLAPRGPDGEGTWRSAAGNVILGHRRLAINDLTPAGTQPMLDPAGRGALCCNGEIYNAPALRETLGQRGHRFLSRSDTEVLLHGFIEWGIDGLLERVRGMFALVIWDERERVLHAAVDHAGMKPLVFAHAKGELTIASDCDALRRAVGESRGGLDGVGLAHVLCLGYSPPPGTVWQGVRKLALGRALTWRPGGEPVVRRWWQPPERIDPAAAPARVEDLGPLLEAVLAEHLMSDVPLGLLLSGGVDSTALAVALRGLGAAPTCYTLGLEGSADESPFAADVCRRLGMPHERLPFDAADLDDTMDLVADAFDEPQGFGALCTQVRVSRLVRERCAVVLGGDGGDEAFAGYAWHSSAPRRDQPYARSHLRRVMPRFTPAEAQAVLAPLGVRYGEGEYANWQAEDDRPALPEPRRAQRLDLCGFCAGSILPKLDRAGMSVGLEVRAPLLDRRILEWALSTAPDEPDAPAKRVLRQYVASHVPQALLQRPKQGFSLRLPPDPSIDERRLALVRDSRLRRDGFLARDWERLVAPGAAERSGKAFTLCAVAAWYEKRGGGA